MQCLTFVLHFLCKTEEDMMIQIEKEKERLTKRKSKDEKTASQSGEKRSKTSPKKDTDCAGSKPSNA